MRRSRMSLGLCIGFSTLDVGRSDVGRSLRGHLKSTSVRPLDSQLSSLVLHSLQYTARLMMSQSSSGLASQSQLCVLLARFFRTTVPLPHLTALSLPQSPLSALQTPSLRLYLLTLLTPTPALPHTCRKARKGNDSVAARYATLPGGEGSLLPDFLESIVAAFMPFGPGNIILAVLCLLWYARRRIRCGSGPLYHYASPLLVVRPSVHWNRLRSLLWRAKLLLEYK